MPTLDPPESFTLPFKLADQCLAVIGEVSYDERPTAEVQSPGFQSAFASGLEIVLKHLRQILPELEHAITPEIEGAASKVAVEYYRLAGPRRKCALLAVKSGCAFILKARHVVTLPTAPADYAMLGGDLHAVAWPKRKDVEALRDGLAAECKLVARELSSAQERRELPAATAPGTPTAPAAQLAKLGVPLRVVAEILQDSDGERTEAMLARWNKSRRKKPDPVGRNPKDRRAWLYEPTAIVAWVKIEEAPLASEEDALIKRLTRLAVEPVPGK